MNLINRFSGLVACMCFSLAMAGGTLSMDGNEVFYDSDTAIGGFQFDIDGATITGAGGGEAEAAGMFFSNSASTVIAFSLSGSTIPAGQGLLCTLDGVDGDIAGLSGLVFSDATGGQIDFTFSSGDDQAGGDDDGEDGSGAPAGGCDLDPGTLYLADDG
ncbi:MAG: hypothetical protein CBD58_04135, partial [bacterium TMED198]